MSPDELAAMWLLARRADGQQWLVVLDELEKATRKLEDIRDFAEGRCDFDCGCPECNALSAVESILDGAS